MIPSFISCINLKYARCPVLYVFFDDVLSEASYKSITTLARWGTRFALPKFVIASATHVLSITIEDIGTLILLRWVSDYGELEKRTLPQLVAFIDREFPLRLKGTLRLNANFSGGMHF